VLVLSKSGPASAFLNQQVVYSLVVRNIGLGSAMNVVISDALPVTALFDGPGSLGDFALDHGPGYWSAGPSNSEPITIGPLPVLAAGQSWTVSLVVKAAPSAADGMTMTNTAQAWADNFNISAMSSASTLWMEGAATPTPTFTISRTFTISPTFTRSATETPTDTATRSATATPSATRTATPSVTPSATRTETPTATLSSTDTSTYTPSITATSTGTITATQTPFAALALGKWASVDVISAPGQAVGYSLGVTNTGTMALENLVVWDTLPANLSLDSTAPLATQQGSLLSWALGSLAPGAYASVSIIASYVGGTDSVMNTASAKADGLAERQSLPVLIGYGIVFTKTATTTATPTFTATPTATPSATASATDTATASSTATITITSTLSGTRTATATQTATATVTGTRTATASPTPLSPVLSLVKSGPVSAFLNQQVVYQMVVHNSGAGAASNVTISDALPSKSAFDGPGILSDFTLDHSYAYWSAGASSADPITIGPLPLLEAGQSWTVSLIVKAAGALDGESMTNTAQAWADNFSLSVSDTASTQWQLGVATATSTPSITQTPTRSPSFTQSPSETASPTITKTSTPSMTPSVTSTPSQTSTQTPFASLALGKSASVDVFSNTVPGESVAYALSLTNTGTMALTGLELWDTLPANLAYASSSPNAVVNGNVLSWAIGSLSPGASAYVVLNATYNGDGNSVANVASAQADQLLEKQSNISQIGFGVAFTKTSTQTPTSTATITQTSTETPTATSTPSVTMSPTPALAPPQLFVWQYAMTPAVYSNTDVVYYMGISNAAGCQTAENVELKNFQVGNSIYTTVFVSFTDLVFSYILFKDLTTSTNWRAMSSLSWPLDRGYYTLAGGQSITGIPVTIRSGSKGLSLTSRVEIAGVNLAGTSVPTAVSQAVFYVVTYEPSPTPQPTPIYAATSTTVPSASPTPIVTEGKIVAYPQPATDILCLAFQSPKDGKMVITLYNAAFRPAGRIEAYVLGGRVDKVCNSIQGLAPGVYMYKAKVDDYEFPMGKFGVAR
jgi:uncharacterized repeat protein (TIGR01451 family)